MSDASTHPIFITARFRSGSTALWNLFHRLPRYRAYYEPCHDNLLTHLDHTAPLPTHRGVESYWDEYLSIRGEVARLHRPELGLTRLVLEAGDTHAELESYLQMLVERAHPRVAVLQFNRMDFRLPWLRARFPRARLVHLWRDPRDSWYSTVRHNPPEEWGDADHPDIYDLPLWAHSLVSAFPFLASPQGSYERHYYLWRLSERMGTRLADCSLAYDADLRPDPSRAWEKLVALDPGLAPHREQALAAVDPGPAREWERFRAESWFAETEASCDAHLERLGLLGDFGLKPLARIREEHPGAWEESRASGEPPDLTPLLLAFSRLRSSLTVSLHRTQELEAGLGALSLRGGLRVARRAGGRLLRRLERLRRRDRG